MIKNIRKSRFTATFESDLKIIIVINGVRIGSESRKKR